MNSRTSYIFETIYIVKTNILRKILIRVNSIIIWCNVLENLFLFYQQNI